MTPKGTPLPEEPPSPGSGEGGAAFVDELDAHERVLLALSKIGTALRTSAWRRAGEAGLTPTQAQVLAVLGRSGEVGLPLHRLATHLGVTPATASDSVAALHRKGLVDKRPSEGDARALSITLTPEGARRTREMAGWPGDLRDATAALGDAERGQLLRLLVKVVRGLQEAGAVAPSRMCVTCRFFRPRVHDDPVRPHHCAFVDAPFGDRNLRLECAEHEPAAPAAARANWRAFGAEVAEP